MLSVYLQMLKRRRLATLWWSVAMAGTSALIVLAYPTVRGNSELDKTFADLPAGLQASFGLHAGASLTSPVGYMNSQFIANTLPLLLLIFAVGGAVRAIAGDEELGTLELLLANPVSRVRVALGRACALATLLAVLAVVSAVTVTALAPVTKLNNGLSAAHLMAGVVAAAFLALTYAALAFAICAATGRRSPGLVVAVSLALVGYVVEGLAAQVHVLRPIRAVMPWHWLIDSDPLQNGLTWQTWLLPVVVSAVLVTAGIVRFAKRDLRQ